MSKVNVKLGICHYSLPIEGPCAVKIASEVGFEGVQLDVIRNYKNKPALFEKITQKKFLEMGKKYNIKYPSIAVRELDQFSMFAEDNIGVNTVKRTVDIARDMNIPTVLIPNFGNSEIKNEQDFNMAVKILSEICDIAADYGIIIATESNLSPEDIERLINSIGRLNIRFYFDTQNHFLHGNYDMAKLLERMMPYVYEVHVKDGKNKDLSGALLGKGDSGFYNCVEVLRKNSYSGWIITENYYDLEPLNLQNNNPVELIKMDFKTLKDAFE